MKSFRIQYLSNLLLSSTNVQPHLQNFKPAAPDLALLGNIGRATCPVTKEFFSKLESYREIQKIFWIPGALELSPSSQTAVTWRQSTDLFYSVLQNDWKLKKTVFCQKVDWKHPTLPLRILATPGWHLLMDAPGTTLVDWDSGGEQYPMTPIDFLKLQTNELQWITNTIDRTTDSVCLLTYSPIPHVVLPSKNILSHLYGTEYVYKPVTVSGGVNPWTALNMAGAKHYTSSAVFEYVYKDLPTYS
jgi:hypothetical protein